jgi:hypothetical protein
MSLHDYYESRRLSHFPFYALIMAAMREADDENLSKLKQVFPETWEELQTRYNQPGGCLPEEGQVG